ncbi:MAG: hypothetical protein JO358_12605 [Alphaproteobacteria bacterium]|nr:hypothetical protein [Alphaproteobacteria bacterium]
MPGLPHYVAQRGNRRDCVFFQVDDYRFYRRLVAAAARRAGTAVWAYCLMRHHLIVTPADADELRATFAEAHRRYTGAINARFRWTAHLFQGRLGWWYGRAAFLGGGPLHRAQSDGRRGWRAVPGTGHGQARGRSLRARMDDLARVAPVARGDP